MRIVCIVAFLDEEDNLGHFLDSVVAQTRLPDELLLVDDGSRDRSRELARAFAESAPWARLLRRPPRPRAADRLADAAELRAFQWALDRVEGDWDVVAKMDADLELSRELLSTIEKAFRLDPRLGIAGGYLSVRDRRTGVSRRERCPPGHVRGPNKFYRRACFEQISPLPPILGWDTIDELAARQAGWGTGSVECPSGDTIHLRPTGSYDGILRAQFRWGVCAHGIGQHPLWVTASALRRLGARPPFLASVAFVSGWLSGFFRRRPRANRDIRDFGRSEQVSTLRKLAVAALRHPSSALQLVRFLNG